MFKTIPVFNLIILFNPTKLNLEYNKMTYLKIKFYFSLNNSVSSNIVGKNMLNNIVSLNKIIFDIKYVVFELNK